MTISSSSGFAAVLQDSEWVRQSLFVPYRSRAGGNARDPDILFNQTISYGTLMFEDTALGGNRVMNPKPQICRFADPKLKSLIAQVQTDLHYTGEGNSRIGKTKTFGMGRWYAEKINQNKQVITLQAGTPQFNSLTNFFTGFYDPYHADAVNTGVIGSNMAFMLGEFIGFVTSWAIVPAYNILSFAYSTGKKIYADLARRPLSKFYYVKPTMALYWLTVQGIVNAMTVNLKQKGGLQPGMIKRGSGGGNGMTIDISSLTNDYTTADLEMMARLMPDLYLGDTGGINVKGLANRFERLADANERKIAGFRDSKPPLSQAQLMEKVTAYLKTGLSEEDVPDLKYPTIASAIKGYRESSAGTGANLSDALSNPGSSEATPADKQGDNSTAINQSLNQTTASTTTSDNLSSSLFDHLLGYKDYLEAELRDGSAFVSFAVDYERHVSESFSNSTKESDIAAKMNSQARTGRESLFSLANGNIGDGFIADSIESFIGLAGDVLKGVADSVGLSGLAMLGGRAFVDIPEFWDTSTVSMPSTSYTSPLRSWSGCPIALLQNIYLPLAMWLALTAPRSTGRASYSSPYCCKLWQKGYAQIQTGIVTELSITRGAGNLGWNVYGQPIAVDLHVTITDLSKIMHIPITADLSLKDAMSMAATGYAVSMFDEDTKFTDLMAVYASLGLNEQYYATNRWRIRNQKVKQNFDSFFSMDNWMSYQVSTLPGQILGMATRAGHIQN